MSDLLPGGKPGDEQPGDDELSRALTSEIRLVPGVAGVYAAAPPLEAAADALAAKLRLREPDALVEIDRDSGALTVTAHIAASASEPAPETVRRVGELLRSRLRSDEVAAITVTVRLIEDVDAPVGS